MRRIGQALSERECMEVLEKGTSGVLALLGEDFYPYAVPLSYVYENAKIYFHSAKSGHKVDAIKNYQKASFCIIDQDVVIPEEYTTYFRSVIAFGKIFVVEEEAEIQKAIEKLAKKYYPEDTNENRKGVIEKEGKSFCILGFVIEHLTGKEAVELVKREG